MYRGQTKKVALTKSLLQADPHNKQTYDAFSTNQIILTNKMQQNLDEQSHEAKAKWVHFKDTYSKTFFQFHETKTKKIQCKASHIMTKSWTPKKS